jgi:hypothetical protein
LAVHGIVYGIGDGILRDVGITIKHSEDIHERYEDAVSRVH